MVDFSKAFSNAVEPSNGQPLALSAYDRFNLHRNFVGMRIAMSMDRSDWFENRAGGKENFSKLWGHVVDGTSNEQFPADMVNQLRDTMRATPYNVDMVEAMVKSMVIKASTPTTSNINAADRAGMVAIINGAASAAATPSSSPTPTGPISVPSTVPFSAPSEALRGTPTRAPMPPQN